MFLLPGFLSAGDLGSMRWKQMPLCSEAQMKAGMPGGEGLQEVQALCYAENNPSVAYLAVDTSQIWKSVDGGLSWSPKHAGFLSHGARSLLVDPKNPEVVFAAGFGAEKKNSKHLQGIYRSTDGATSWKLVRKTDFYKQASNGCLFAFDSTVGNGNRTPVVYCGSYGEGLLRSEDGGDTWTVVGFHGAGIIDIEESPAVPGKLLVATEKGLYTYREGKIGRLGNGLPDWPRSIAVSRNKPAVVYAAIGKGGVYRSADNGETFKACNGGLPLSLDYVDIAASPVDADIVYLRAQRVGARPFYSHDGGASWQKSVNTNKGGMIENESFYFSGPFAPHPRKALWALHVSNGKTRIIRTQDGGRTWAYSGSGFTGGRAEEIVFIDGQRMLLCLTDFGLWLTENHGASFRELPLGRIMGLQSSSSAVWLDGSIVASLGTWGNKGLAASHDGGENWDYFPDLVDRFKYIGLHPQRRGTIYAGPFLSRDSGRTWERLAYSVRAVDSRNGDVIFAFTKIADGTCSLLRSSNQGHDWDVLTDCPFRVPAVQDVSLVIRNDNPVFYIATDNGLWVYQSGTWFQRGDKDGLLEDQFGMCWISSVAVDPQRPDCVYIGRRAPGSGESNGVFFSNDGGLTWRNINLNLGKELSVWSVHVSPFDSAVYIGTSLGTWSLTGEKQAGEVRY